MVFAFSEVLEGIFVKRILLAEESLRCRPGILVHRHLFLLNFMLFFFFFLTMIVQEVAEFVSKGQLGVICLQNTLHRLDDRVLVNQVTKLMLQCVSIFHDLLFLTG